MKKIMVVDDSYFVRESLKKLIPKEKYILVGEADNGVDAIERFRELSPDYVMLDIAMPDMDGLTALKEILKIKSETKVIMCSAMGQRPVLKDALDSGAIDFIIKPFEENKVIELLNEIYEE